jgi:hypothetical protein
VFVKSNWRQGKKKRRDIIITLQIHLSSPEGMMRWVRTYGKPKQEAYAYGDQDLRSTGFSIEDSAWWNVNATTGSKAWIKFALKLPLPLELPHSFARDEGIPYVRTA